MPDTLPLVLTRTYRQQDANTRPFGVGTNFPYGIFLWSAQQYQNIALAVPSNDIRAFIGAHAGE